jgi:hypothetical protein
MIGAQVGSDIAPKDAKVTDKWQIDVKVNYSEAGLLRGCKNITMQQTSDQNGS